MARSNFRFYETYYPYFLTCSVIEGVDLFGYPEIAQIVLDSLSHIQNKMKVKIYGYVLMHNHIHFIAESENLSEDIRRFKSFTAREVIRYLEYHSHTVLLERLKKGKRNHKKECTYQVWQEGSYPKQINTLKKMENFMEYIHYNPVKSGFVNKPTHWGYSSASDYLGDKGLINIMPFEG